MHAIAFGRRSMEPKLFVGEESKIAEVTAACIGEAARKPDADAHL